MIGSGLKKFAEEYHLTAESGVVHGWLQNCYVAFSEGAGYKRLAIYIGCHHAGEDEHIPEEGTLPAHMQAADQIADFILEKAGEYKKYRLMPSGKGMPGVVLTQGGSVVQVNFFDNPGTLKCIRNFIEDILPQLAPLTAPRECAACAGEQDATFLPVLMTDQAVVPMHSHCAEKITAALSQANAHTRSALPVLPILGALLGALLGAVVWAAVGILGYMASIVGLLIAFLASKGYDLLGGKPGALKIVTLIVCVILAVAAGTVGCEIYGLHTFYQEEVQKLGPMETAVPEMEFLKATVPLLWQEAEVLKAVVKDAAMGLLFAMIGCLDILRRESQRIKGKTKAKILSGRI